LLDRFRVNNRKKARITRADDFFAASKRHKKTTRAGDISLLKFSF